MKVTAIIAAAGQGKRMGGGINKVFIPLFDCPVLVHSVLAFSQCPEVDELVIVSASGEVVQVETMLNGFSGLKPWRVIAGGAERQYSIARALEVTEPMTDIILVHDGARPLIDTATISSLIVAAAQFRAAGVAVPVKDTIKVVDEAGFIVGTPERKKLWAMQTPQAFEASLLREAYRMAELDGYLGTDDAGLVERLDVRIKVIQGNYKNIKITTPEDLLLAKTLMGRRRETDMVRFGMGYDVHQLVGGRKLILGGVEIPHSQGLQGHSDADVLLHAIKDALLGAAALGDIGRHFPDSDSQYKGISSLLLLEKVSDIIGRYNYHVNNIDATIVAEKPKLASYIDGMVHNIAAVLKIDIGRVNIKATTTEGLGFAGRQEGIAAYAVASIVKD